MQLIDADELEKRGWTMHRTVVVNPQTMEMQVKKPTDFPAIIDAVPVVRCKDCKHYQFADNRAFGMPVKMCEWFGFEDVDDYDFCSRAERSEDE